jgi:hypothetical protein
MRARGQVGRMAPSLRTGWLALNRRGERRGIRLSAARGARRFFDSRYDETRHMLLRRGYAGRSVCRRGRASGQHQNGKEGQEGDGARVHAP